MTMTLVNTAIAFYGTLFLEVLDIVTFGRLRPRVWAWIRWCEIRA
jgi:hypothetical protein